MCCRGGWRILQFVLRCFLPMCYLLFWLLERVLLASLFFSWVSIGSSWSSRVQRLSLWTLWILYCCALLFCFLFPLQVCLDVFSFLVFNVFAILLSLFFLRECGPREREREREREGERERERALDPLWRELQINYWVV